MHALNAEHSQSVLCLPVDAHVLELVGYVHTLGRRLILRLGY